MSVIVESLAEWAVDSLDDSSIDYLRAWASASISSNLYPKLFIAPRKVWGLDVCSL